MKKISLLFSLLFISLLGSGQLPTSNITTTLVGNEIGNASHNVGVLCTAPTINKWSKYKPVRGAYPTAVDGKYGLNITGGWAYLKPQGGETEPYRLGDFRQYEHNQANTLPPAYVKLSTSSFNTGGPTNGKNDAVFAPDVFGQLILNDNGVTGVSEISLTNLGLQGYYFGMGIISTYSYYKTMPTVAANGQMMSVDIFTGLPETVNELASSYAVFFLSPTPVSTWSSIPAGIIYLPHETVNGFEIISSQTILFNLWMLCGGVNPATFPAQFPYSMYESGNIQNTADISTDINAISYVDGWKVISKPIWLDLQVRTTDGGDRILNPPYYEDAYNTVYIKGTLNQSNTGAIRSENIVLGKQDNTGLINIMATQQAGPATAYLKVCPGDSWTFASGYSATIGAGIITVSFTPVDLSATSVEITATVVRRGYEDTALGLDTGHEARDGYSTTFPITVTIVGGYVYDVYIRQSATLPCLQEPM